MENKDIDAKGVRGLHSERIGLMCVMKKYMINFVLMMLSIDS